MTDWWQNDPVVAQQPSGGDWWHNDPVVGGGKPTGVMDDPGGGLSVIAGFPVIGPGLIKAGSAIDAALGSGDTFGDRYQKEVAKNEGYIADFEKAHPTAAKVAEGAGAAIGTVPAVLAAPGAFGAAGAGTLASMAAGAGSGAALSAADAFVRGEDPGHAALWGAAGGAAGPVIGKAVGAAAPVVGRAAISGASKLLGREAMSTEAAAEARATAKIADALKRDSGKGLSEEEFASAQRRGQPVTLMDLGGQVTQRLAKRSANISPEAQETLGRTIGSRYRTQNDRAADWLDSTFNFPNSDATQSAIQEAARTVNRPAYAKAYSEGAHGLWNDDLAQISQAPVVQDAIRKAMVSAKNEAAKLGFDAPTNPFMTDAAGRIVLKMGANGERQTPNLQFWDIVKRGLDKTGTREAKEWSNILRGTLDEQVPSYATARAGAAKAFGAQDALEAGKNAVDAKMTNRQMRDALGKMSDVEKRLFQDGFVDRYVQKIREAPDRRNIIDMINGSPAARERVTMAIGPQRAKELEAFLRVEGHMDRARGAMGGSPTAQNAYDIGIEATDLLRPKEMLSKALQGAAKMANRKVDERAAEKIAEMLTSSDPKQVDRAVKAIANNKNMMSTVRNLPQIAGAAVTRGAVQGSAAGAGQGNFQ